MKKKNLNEGDIFRTLIEGDLQTLFSNLAQINKSEKNKKSFIFIVGPDGKIEMKDLNKPKQEQKYETCPDCNGDGYLVCDDCGGDGYTVERTRLGEKNIVHTCSVCDGTGDIICNTCGGSGMKPEESDIDTEETIDNIVHKDLIDTAIRNLFLSNTHHTIIGPVKMIIKNIQYGKHGIYVIPYIEQEVLIPDADFERELDVIRKQFLVEIDIPSIFYHKISSDK